MKVSYLSIGSSPGFVTMDGDRQLVRFLPGRHALFLVHPGTVSVVTIETGGRLCVGDIVVGDLHPFGAGRP